MHRINYFFIATVSIFIGAFIGAFLMARSDMDFIHSKDTPPQPAHIENNYYIKNEKNFFLPHEDPIPPKILPSKTL